MTVAMVRVFATSVNSTTATANVLPWAGRGWQSALSLLQEAAESWKLAKQYLDTAKKHAS